jgi:hypothetical protein
MKLKLVAITNLYKNIGSLDLQMWRCVGANEYIVARFDEEPTWKDVGTHINKFIHSLEGKISEDVKEAYAGFELYGDTSLTHGENFQLHNGGTIDFPAQDVTKIDVTEEMDGLQGL